MGKKRDSKGRFTKGNTEGVKFSSTNQPSNSGRKPSRFKKILESLENVGKQYRRRTTKKITGTLLTMTANELETLVEDESTPVAVILIANAISGDLNNQRMDNLEKLLDRIFGKTTNNVDVTSKGDSIKPLSMDAAKKIIDELGQ